MALRSMKIYFFLFLYGLIFSVIVTVPDFYALLVTFVIFEPSADHIFSSIFMSSIMIIVVFSCALTSLFAVISWRILGKIHPVAFILAYIVLSPLVGLYLIQVFDVSFIGIWMTNFLTMAPTAMAATCWLGKQIYDIKGREIALTWGGVKPDMWKTGLGSAMIFIISALAYLAITLGPLYLANISMDEQDTITMARIMSLPGLWVPMLPMLASAFYVFCAVMRNKQLTMVHFTRIAIVLAFVLQAIITFAVAFSKGTFDSHHVAILLLTMFSELFISVCQISLILSLSFWLVMKWTKPKTV